MFKSPKEAFKDIVKHMEANKGNIRGLRLYAFNKSAGSDNLLLNDRGDILLKRGEIEESEVIELLQQYTQYIKYDDSTEPNSSNTIGLEIVLKGENEEENGADSCIKTNIIEKSFLCDINQKDAFKEAIEYIENNKENVKSLRFCAFKKNADSKNLLVNDKSDVLSKKQGEIEQVEVLYLIEDYVQYIKNNNSPEIKDSNVIGLYIAFKNDESDVKSSLDIETVEVKAPEIIFLCDVNETELFCRENKFV